MKEYIKIKYPELFDLYNESINFYDLQLKSIKFIEANNLEEYYFKLILLQYCIIAKQDLESIFILGA